MSAQGAHHSTTGPSEPVASSGDNGHEASKPVIAPAPAASISSKDDVIQVGQQSTEPPPSGLDSSGTNDIQTNPTEAVSDVVRSSLGDNYQEDVDLPDDDFGDPIDVDFEVFWIFQTTSIND